MFVTVRTELWYNLYVAPAFYDYAELQPIKLPIEECNKIDNIYKQNMPTHYLIQNSTKSYFQYKIIKVTQKSAISTLQILEPFNFHFL